LLRIAGQGDGSSIMVVRFMHHADGEIMKSHFFDENGHDIASGSRH